MDKFRIITFLAFLVIFTVIFQLGSMSTVSEEKQICSWKNLKN